MGARVRAGWGQVGFGVRARVGAHVQVKWAGGGQGEGKQEQVVAHVRE